MVTASPNIDARTDCMTAPTDFAELYERHYGTVYRAALRITGNPADAEDVLQTVFLRFLSHGGSVNPLQPEAYFRRASANAAVDVLRRRVLHSESQLHDETRHAPTGGDVLLKERLRRAIAALDQSDAVLFLLRYVEGLSNGELAAMFRLEKNSVAVRLFRIRQTLQAEMER